MPPRCACGTRASDADEVAVVYEQGGRLFNVRAGQVVMASGGWVNKHLLVDMPEDLRTAYGQFSYAPALIVNVALRQWRFLYDLDITACRWFDDTDGFGYCCNLRQNMVTARHAPPLHPDKPAVLSFYLGLPVTGLPAATQGMAARARLMSTDLRRLRAPDPPADATAVRCIGLQTEAATSRPSCSTAGVTHV